MQPRKRHRVRSIEHLERRELLFAPMEQLSVLGGLDSLANALDRAETHAEYAQALPGVDLTAGEIADASEAIRLGLIEPLSTILDGTAQVALADVADALSGYSASSGGSTVSIADGSVSAEQVSDSSGARIEVTATLNQSHSQAIPMGDFGDAAWISWSDSPPQIDVLATTELTITLGVNLVSEEFFAEIDEVVTQVTTDVTRLAATLNVGPAEASVIDGRIQLDATLTADFGGVELLKNDLDGSAIDSLVTIKAEGGMDVALPVEFSLGDYASSETITWQDSHLFDGVDELPELSASGDLIAAVRIDQEDLAGFFSMIGTKLDELLGEDLPNWSSDFLPWVRGLKLPDLSGVSQKISEFADDDLTDEDGRARFRTFEDLRQLLEDWTGRDAILSYLPSTSELMYEFEVAAPIDAGTFDMATRQDYGALAGIDVTGTATASGEFVFSGVFGVDLTALREDTTPSDITDDDSWADHFYLDDLELTADVGVASNSASAAARLGFVGVGVGEIGLAAGASAAMQLADQSSTDGRITFKRLSELIVSDPTSLVASSSLDGDAEVVLGDLTVNGIPGLELDGGEITIGISDISDPSTFTFDVNTAASNINSLSTVSIDQWVDLAGDVIAMVDDLTRAGKWDEDLPGIGQSVNDLLDHAARLQQAVEGLLDTDATTIQELGERLETLLEGALRISPDALDVLLSWQDGSLKMSLQYALAEQTSRPLSIDMAELIAASNSDTAVFDLLGDLVDVAGETSIDASASLNGSLVFGVDVSGLIAGTSAQPQFFVDDTSGLDVELELAASDLDASVAVGPLGLFVRGGSVTIDGDGDAATSGAAEISVGLKDASDGRYSATEIKGLTTSDIDTEFLAGASIVLPLYFPTASDPVGGSTVSNANAIVVGIGNVLGLFDDSDADVILQAPDVNSLIDSFDPLDQGLQILADGLDALLQKIESLLREQVLNQNLPLVGKELGTAADFLRDICENALPILRDQLQPQQLVDEIKQVLYDALGPVMVLSDINGDNVLNHLDVDLSIEPTTQEVALNLSLGDSYSVDAGIDFDLGLPGLGLDLDGAVEASLDWAIDLGVGINSVDGFFLATGDVNEIEIDVEVTLPDASLTGTLGLFQITVADQGSKLAGHFDVDLLEPSGDGKLTLSEMLGGSAPLGDLVHTTLSGAANVDLGLVAGTTFAKLPEVHADFILDWGFDGTNLKGSVDRLAIENIELDLGSFISGFAGDVLERVQSVLKPIEPIVDILTEPLPVANDLEFLVDTFAAETAPYDAVNLLDMASLLGNVNVEMLDAIVQIVDLASSIPTPAAGESVMIPLGEVVIVSGGSDPDLVSSDNAAIDDSDIKEELANFSGSDEQERFAQESSSFIDKMTSIRGGGFQFPILDNPASLIGVLLGQDATLFAYQTPRLTADFSMGVTVPITGPLAVEFVGGIGVDAQFSFGYDTLGLRNFIQSKDVLDLADGFFVSDRENVDGTGADVAEVNLRGSLEAFATLTAGVASASIGGGIYATVGANLNDNDGDGKVRIGEFVGNLPLCAFDFAGSLSAGLRVKAQVLGVPFSQNIATVRLLEFSTGCSGAQELALGEIDDQGVYTLLVGDQASRREVGVGVNDEYVTFSPTLDADGKDAVEVSGFGITEIVRDVTKIVARAGDGDDSLVVIGALGVPVEFHGEQGNDELVGGAANDVLRGGGDDDLIQGGDGDDQIFGGAGLNTLEGGAGNDLMFGGDRDDYIDGGADDDTIESGGGRDIVLGGVGMDTIHAGDGDDQVFGGFGIDIIYAGAGNDAISGGDGDDVIEGEAGDDAIEGQAGNDFIRGGDGADRLFGGAGSDILFGGYQTDSLWGGGDNDVLIGGNDVPTRGPDNSDDQILGGDGDDILIGDDGAVLDFDGENYIIEVLSGSGNDTLHGEEGKDWAHGVGGRDHIFGGLGNDHLIGGDDSDTIWGQEGSDWLEGGDGDDEVFGHAGGDLIAGGRGADILDGGDDEDQLFAHENGGAEPWYVNPVETDDDAAEDILLGRAGSDELVGGDGNDFLDGGAGADALIGGAGDDTLEGGLGDDYCSAIEGHDQVVGEWGDDQIAIGRQLFTRIDGEHRSKNPSFIGPINISGNRLDIAEGNVNLDFTDPNTPHLEDIRRIDAQFAPGVQMRLDPNSVAAIADSRQKLRIDLSSDATVELDGAWIEREPIEFDGIGYRQLENSGTILQITDLQPNHNSMLRADVNGDGFVSPLDALLVINHLNSGTQLPVRITADPSAPKRDTNGDNFISPIDVLLIINELNSRDSY